MTLSAVILARDEEQRIKEAIKSVDFADEIIVVDDNSQDNTAVLAQKSGAIVIKRSLAGDFAGQRNFALSKATGKWVLFIDADERVSKELKAEIIQIVNNPFVKKEGFKITRQDVLFDQKMVGGEFGKTNLLRLALRTQGTWHRKVHETWEVRGRIGKLKCKLYHYPHEDLHSFLSSINYFSTLHAEANKAEGKRSNLFKILLFPPLKLFDNLILKLGVLDGINGFVASMMMSFHSFLAWSKLWLIQNKK